MIIIWCPARIPKLRWRPGHSMYAVVLPISWADQHYNVSTRRSGTLTRYSGFRSDPIGSGSGRTPALALSDHFTSIVGCGSVITGLTKRSRMVDRGSYTVFAGNAHFRLRQRNG